MSIQSTSSQTTSVTATGSNYWLKVPGTPSLNMRVILQNDPFQVEGSQPQGTITGMGAYYSYVQTDGVKSAVIPAVFVFLDDESYQSFIALRSLAQVLLLQSPVTGEQWYVMLGPTMKVEVQAPVPGTSDIQRVVTVSCTEVERP